MSRKIILLSDGTGNSSISRDKSNVWRLYQSLDLGLGPDGKYEQIAFYDDGVGTSGFRPLWLLGGVFGLGLSRNVRQLYTDLCRHYRPGDKIYIFGFSRGAFTARVLAHFIETCGITNASQHCAEEKIKKAVKAAYKSYRSRFWRLDRGEASTGGATGIRGWYRRYLKYSFPKLVALPFRNLRNLIPAVRVLLPEEFKRLHAHSVEDPNNLIEFIGCWDTVDALGLPIDELADFVDRWIYPYKFQSQTLGRGVSRAAHALAIDDERHTFHPVLWEQKTARDLKRITQVWFTGMHADVGGGYPEDNLAYITLTWMIRQVDRARIGIDGLTFQKRETDVFERQAQPGGVLHNSRRGAAVMYRYKPRNIHRICDNHLTEVVLHHTVLERIRAAEAGYAPAGIPKNYAVYDKNGSIDRRLPNSPYYELPDDIERRGNYLSKAEDYIGWGRVAYLAMLSIFLYLLVMPFLFPPIVGFVHHYSDQDCFAGLQKFIVSAIGGLDTILPEYWVLSWQQHLLQLAYGLGLFVLFLLCGKVCSAKVKKYAEVGWTKFRGVQKVQNISSEANFLTDLANLVRTSGSFIAGRRFLAQTLFPSAFFLTVVFVVFAFCSRHGYLGFADRVEACEASTATIVAKKLPLKTEKIVNFNTKDPCFVTGIDMEVGRVYEVEVNVDEPWIDLRHPASPNGLDHRLTALDPIFIGGLTVRREQLIPWFTLLGEIGRDSGDIVVLNKSQSAFKFKAPRSGPLYLYVNDALNISNLWRESGDWDAMYRNNEGTAIIRIERVE